MGFKFRKANLNDIDELEHLIELSAKSINSLFYTESEINAALGNVWAVDKQLLIDQTYWIVENLEGIVIGCGGWSKRKLLFGKPKSLTQTESELKPGLDPARIRAFFVHPEYTRRGIGKKLLIKSEIEAQFGGYNSLELVATLSGEKLFSAQGYKKIKTFELNLGNGITNKVVLMNKTIASTF